KFTRKPGPVIKSIAVAKADSPVPEITILGENLSSEADYFIDGKKLPLVPEAERQADEPKGDLITPVPQDQAADPKFCSQITITIMKRVAQIEFGPADHVFRILTRDGQFSDIRFTADAPKVESMVMEGAAPPPAGSVTAGKSPVTLAITGSGFRAG